MFFPNLTRRKESDYHHTGGKFYADYTQNYEKISKDCLHRCIYCDILTEEMGGEGMQLDHFRPQKYFSDLKAHPCNLCLACPKCNRLKSDDWPCEKYKDSPSFVGGLGYLDPFNIDRSKYLRVDNDGQIKPKDGPVKYMIEKMFLNRQSRTQIRRRRLLAKKKEQLSASITKLMEQLLQDTKVVGSQSKDFSQRLEHILLLKRMLDESYLFTGPNTFFHAAK